MLHDSDDFVHLALDVCDKQESGIIKTQAAKLLESLCDNIEGTVSFLAIFVCNAMTWAMHGKPDPATTPEFEVLTQFVSSNFLS